jgi:hypothetical protein
VISNSNKIVANKGVGHKSGVVQSVQRHDETLDFHRVAKRVAKKTWCCSPGWPAKRSCGGNKDGVGRLQRAAMACRSGGLSAGQSAAGTGVSPTRPGPFSFKRLAFWESGGWKGQISGWRCCPSVRPTTFSGVKPCGAMSRSVTVKTKWNRLYNDKRKPVGQPEVAIWV